MKLFKALKGLLSGDLVKNGLDFINTRWPPDMSEAQRAEMEVVIKDMLHKQEMDIAEAAREDEQLFNERTIALEGTAKDLKTIPYIGGLIIFLRGAFRPLFAYLTAYLIWKYFLEGMSWTERQETLLLAISLLVLIFFFGERALKNVMPLIAQVFAVKPQKND